MTKLVQKNDQTQTRFDQAWTKNEQSLNKKDQCWTKNDQIDFY